VNGFSAQTLALFLVLTPGFLFLAGTYFAPQRYPTRIDPQRGVIIDTALFVVVSALLHSTVGMVLLYLINWGSSCAIIRSLASAAGASDMALDAAKCSVHTVIGVMVAYSIILSAAALAAGRFSATVVGRRPELYAAIYGPYYDIVRAEQPFVIANVLTKTSEDGRILAYEGKLIELALTGSKTINYVCLESAARFYMTLEEDGARTTPRAEFQPIDKPEHVASRITLPGSEIANLVTRTYAINVTDVPASTNGPPLRTRRSFFDRLLTRRP